MRWGSILAAAVAVLGACKAPAEKPKASDDAAAVQVPADPILRLAEAGVAKTWIYGAAIAVVETGKPTRFVFVGDDGFGRRPNATTIFEIGSITKVFTGLLLAEAAERGEVEIDGLAAKQTSLPIPSHDGVGPTLRHLSNHSSGLPRMPGNWHAKDLLDPYVGYGRAEFVEFLGSHRLRRPPGSRYEYSNVGAAVLGTILADRVGVDYETLLNERVTRPLGMKDTAIVFSREQGRRVARGHNGVLAIVPGWTSTILLAPTGAIRSTVSDMARFARVQLEPTGPLAAAIRESQELTDVADQRLGLGWHSTEAGDLWHNGATGGFHCFMTIDQRRRVAVVVLANTASNTVDGLGSAVLRAAVGEGTTFEWP